MAIVFIVLPALFGGNKLNDSLRRDSFWFGFYPTSLLASLLLSANRQISDASRQELARWLED